MPYIILKIKKRNLDEYENRRKHKGKITIKKTARIFLTKKYPILFQIFICGFSNISF